MPRKLSGWLLSRRRAINSASGVPCTHSQAMKCCRPWVPMPYVPTSERCLNLAAARISVRIASKVAGSPLNTGASTRTAIGLFVF
jgi:hypothetical protein